MFMRIFRAVAHPGTHDELAAIMQNFIDNDMQGVPGVYHLYCGADPETNQVCLVSIWDNKESMLAAAPKVRAFAEQIASQLAEPPIVQPYEILAQL